MMQPVDSALVDSVVRLAVSEELERSRLVRVDSEDSWWAGTLAEVERLRSVVTDQAARIAQLEGQLSQLQDELSRVELGALVLSVSQSIADAANALNGYAVSEARVDVKAMVRLASGQMLLTADPSGLLQPDALSTIGISLKALPPPAGAGTGETQG